jgi:hypothetical protein
MTILLALLISASPQACFRSDVAAMCCASACEVKARRGPFAANEALGQCARSIGCGGWGWSVMMTCGC